MICQQCHKDKPDVVTRIDPFVKEIYDEEIEMDLCDECTQERRADI